MLLGPTDLFESSENILHNSDLLLGLRRKEFWCMFFRKTEKCMCDGLIFSFVIIVAIVAK